MLHGIPPILHQARLEQFVFFRIDTITQVTVVTHGNLLIPTFFSDRILPLEREDTTHRNCNIRQCQRDRRVFRTLVHIHGSRNTERIIRETLCYTDTGPFGILVRICKTLRARIEAVQVITVITAGRKVHTRRESPVRICLRVLRVCPVQLEVLRQAIIGKSLVAQTGNQIGGIETARKLIPFPIRRTSRQSPRTFRIDFTGQGQVHIIAQRKIIPAVAQIETTRTFIPESGHDNARRIRARKREETERQTDRIKRDVLKHHIDGTRHDIFLRADFRLRHLDIEMGVIMLVASRIPSPLHIQDIVVHLFGTSGRHITFALLRDHICDISFFRTEIIAHRLGFILLVAIFEKRIAEFLPDRVEAESGIHQATVHIHLDFLGLKFDLLIFHIAFPK